MAMIPGDERELLLPLYAGLHERPVWTTFLARLRARTRATRTVLIIGAPDQTARAVIHQSPAHSPESLESLVAALPLPMNAMRPGRVYALDESPDPPSPTPDQPRIAYGRLLRIAPAEDLHAWLFLLHDRADFAAADSALLSGLAPHLSVAIETALRLDLLSLRAEMAEDALALLGIAQAALNADGQVIAGTLPATDGAPRALTAPLARACTQLAGQPGHTRLVLRHADSKAPALLLRLPAPQGLSIKPPAAAIATFRHARREDPVSGARILAATLGISTREAQLAEALSRGVPLAEAGAALGLTRETARSYSKRIYAKTGTSGQADLVRLVLTGLAPLA